MRVRLRKLFPGLLVDNALSVSIVFVVLDCCRDKEISSRESLAA